jgi:tripartite-type tricarboxylate transporter receptor subunit TctC
MDGHQAGIKRNAFEKKGSAKGVVTALVNDEVYRRLKLQSKDSYYWEDKELKAKIEAEVRKEYDVKEYTLNE